MQKTANSKQVATKAKMTNPTKKGETTGMPMLNFTHKWVCAKIMLQHCGRQAQVQELDAKAFRRR